LRSSPGSIPLAIALGRGAGARQALGTAVVFGMLVATLVGVFLHPGVLRAASARQRTAVAVQARAMPPHDTRRALASEAHRHARATAIAAHSD
jgi:hypothetical protein